LLFCRGKTCLAVELHAPRPTTSKANGSPEESMRTLIIEFCDTPSPILLASKENSKILMHPCGMCGRIRNNHKNATRLLRSVLAFNHERDFLCDQAKIR
jgi:hypothetical protein